MTKFKALQSITEIPEFARVVFALVRKAESQEGLERELSMEISNEGLQTLRSIARSGNYPLSLEGMQ